MNINRQALLEEIANTPEELDALLGEVLHYFLFLKDVRLEEQEDLEDIRQAKAEIPSSLKG